jgi:hypothetical protein
MRRRELITLLAGAATRPLAARAAASDDPVDRLNSTLAGPFGRVATVHQCLNAVGRVERQNVANQYW